MPEFTLSETEAVEEVRAALAGLAEKKIPDQTVEQAVYRFAKPWVEGQIKSSATNEDVNNAVIAYAAELTFSAWFSKSRMRDRELEVFTEPRVYRNQLEQRTNEVFALYEIARPPRTNHITEVAYPTEEAREEALE